jgi:hypothetical protein
VIPHSDFEWEDDDDTKTGLVVVRLNSTTQGNRARHILINSFTEALCGLEIQSDVETISDTTDPLNLISDACADCEADWRRMRCDVDREMTVMCECIHHRPAKELSTVFRTVPVSRARGLIHSEYADEVPLCRNCYEWILRQENSVSTPYEEADVWL